MVKLFEGSQFIRIIFRFQQQFWMTRPIVSLDFYDEDLTNFLTRFDLSPTRTKVISYDMNHKSSHSGLTVVAVFLVDLTKPLQSQLDKLDLDNDAQSLQKYKEKMSESSCSLGVFANEGSSIKLVKE